MNQKQWTVEIPESFWEEQIKDYWCSGFEKGKYNLETFPLSGRLPEGPLGITVRGLYSYTADCETPLIEGKWYRGYLRNEARNLEHYYRTHTPKKSQELIDELFERRRQGAVFVVFE